MSFNCFTQHGCSASKENINKKKTLYFSFSLVIDCEAIKQKTKVILKKYR